MLLIWRKCSIFAKNRYLLITITIMMNKENKKKLVENNEAAQRILKEGKLPNGYKPIVMSNVEEYLRSQGDINTEELLEIINKFT